MRRVVLAILVPMLALVACASTNNNPPAQPDPTPTTCSAPASSAVPPTAEALPDSEAGWKYVCAPERLAAYDKAWPAAQKVAEGILNNTFGPYDSFAADKRTPVTRNSGYTGWGGLHAQNKQAYAYVWWQNGVVDFSKGVQAFSLYGVLIDKSSHDFPYGVTVQQDGYTSVMSPNFFGSQRFVQGEYHYPTSAQAAKAIDDRALALLNAGVQKAHL